MKAAITPIPPAETPGLLVDDVLAARLRSTPGVAVAEIAGRDSAAAVVAAVRDNDIRLIVPTVVHTGTEYGDPAGPDRVVSLLAGLLDGRADVLAPIHLGSPRLWAALNGRFAAEIARTFGRYSPCAACHLYMHVCRVPLSWHLGAVPVIAGERDTHGGRAKVSQTPAGIDASIEVLAHAGIELLQPIRHIVDGEEIELLIGEWPRRNELACVLSGNYTNASGGLLEDPSVFDDFTERFALPAGIAIVDAWRSDPEPDYASIVAGVLANAS